MKFLPNSRFFQAFVLSLMLVFVAFADEPNFKDFDDYQSTVSKATVEKRLKDFLIKSSELEVHYSVSNTEFRLYASADDKKKDIAEYIFKFGSEKLPASRLPKVREKDSKAPLKGIRIALDPGHLGGEFARAEARYIDMKDFPDVKFDEGTLTVVTALYLKELLEKDGATVLVTRTKPGESVYPVSFPKWRESKEFEAEVDRTVAKIADPEKQKAAKEWWLKTAKEGDIFRGLYNNLDLAARAEKINAFKPDLTAIIHYNAGGGNDKETGKNLGTKDNYNMVFIPGAFMKNELSRKTDRYEFLRLLVTNDLDDSLRVATRLAIQIERNLAVPLAETKQAAYLQSSCLPLGNGVYSRNLGLTRTVKGPLCYGESLCQDNLDECKLLSKNTIELAGFKTSPRVKSVAVSYYEIILNYFK